MFKTTDFKLTFLGIIPILRDESGVLNPEQISAFSALLTFKGKSVKQLLSETIEKGKDVNQKVRAILKKSSLRGHASIATTPCLAFTYEASKFLDSMLTGIVFSSSLMASGRRTETNPSSIVYPNGLLGNAKARKLYKAQSEENINCVNWLLEKGVEKDQATKILQYGHYGTGIIVLPIESIIGFIREYELEKDWLPEEAGILLATFKKYFRQWGIEQLFFSRLVSPRDIYPYPNIFKNPASQNLVRELKVANKKTTQVIDCKVMPTRGLKKKLKELVELIKNMAKDKSKIVKEWPKLLAMRRGICRDYNLAAEIKVLSSPAWRVWGEKKRHRTVPQVVESIYYCIERTWTILKKLRTKDLGPRTLQLIEKVFSVPPVIWENSEWVKRYVECVIDSFATYKKLLDLGVKPRDAIFIIPRGIRIDVLQSYNLYNLISGYYPLRLCKTAEEQLRALTVREVAEIKKLLAKKKFPELTEAIQVKCHTTCFCHEEEFCGQINALVKDYDDDFHQKMLLSLEEKYLASQGVPLRG